MFPEGQLNEIWEINLHNCNGYYFQYPYNMGIKGWSGAHNRIGCTHTSYIAVLGDLFNLNV